MKLPVTTPKIAVSSKGYRLRKTGHPRLPWVVVERGPGFDPPLVRATTAPGAWYAAYLALGLHLEESATSGEPG